MMCSSAFSGGHACAMLPSSKYIFATRFCVATMLSMPSAKISLACNSGLSIASVKTACGWLNTRPKNAWTNRALMRQPSRLARTFLPAWSKSAHFSRNWLAMRNFGSRSSALMRAPDFRHDQAHVVIHAQIRADVAGGGDERVVAGEDERHERVVQVNDRRQRVERAFGQRAFGTGAGGGRRFAGHAANHFHEQFRQLEEMHRVVARQRAHAFFRRIVAAARQHGGDRRVQRLAQRHAAAQARGDFREIGFARRGRGRAAFADSADFSSACRPRGADWRCRQNNPAGRSRRLRARISASAR